MGGNERHGDVLRCCKWLLVVCLGLSWPSFSYGKEKGHPLKANVLVRYYSVPGQALSQKELQCLALNVFHEARGESLAGQVGVAQVTLNRVEQQHRGRKTICTVVFDPKQFSWTGKAGKPSYLAGKAWKQAKVVAEQVGLGLRIHGLEHALYFHHRKKRPRWNQQKILTLVIDNHFYWRNI